MNKLIIAIIFLCSPFLYSQSNFTITGTGTIKGNGTLSLNGNIVVCGPPNFNCSSKATGVITQPTPPALPNLSSVGYAYSVPGDPYYPTSGIGNCYTALTDLTSGLTESAHASWSGGGSNIMSDISRAYFAITDHGGQLWYFHGSYDANGCLHRDSPLVLSPSGGTRAGFSFSRDTAATAYKIAPAGKQALGDPATGTILYQEALSGTTTVTVTRTKLFDYNNCPGVDGTKITQGGNGNLNVDYISHRYSTSLNFPPATDGQDGAHWIFGWDRSTNSCSTYYTGIVPSAGENPANGNIWAFCTGNCSQHGSNPAPLANNTTCDPGGYGIHGIAGHSNGLYVDISGKCAGPTTNNNSTFWTIGANILRNCNPNLYQCGGHGTSGYAMQWTTLNSFVHRPANDLTTWTVIRPLFASGLTHHGGDNWIGPAADLNPFMISINSNNVANPCNTLAYCNELAAVRLDGKVSRFGPNFYKPTGAGNDLGAIMSMTQDGYCIVFESTWNNTRGIESDGTFHKDVFAECNLQ